MVIAGASAAGGATDQCRDNLRAAWPLLQQVGMSPQGLLLLSESSNSCSALRSEDDLISWAQHPYFFMAEGNYPVSMQWSTAAAIGFAVTAAAAISVAGYCWFRCGCCPLTATAAL